MSATASETRERATFEGWAIVELMGHRRLAGHVSEQEIAGVPFLRLDVPDTEEPLATQFYSASAVYAITPTTEETARAVATLSRPAPVTEWDVSRLALPASTADLSCACGHPASVHFADDEGVAGPCRVEDCPCDEFKEEIPF